MHEKEVNVCVMPENMQELLLDRYKKENISWQCELHDTHLGATKNGPNFDDGSVSPLKHISFECANGTSNVDQVMVSCRNCSTGVKRSRDESPCSDDDPANLSSQEMPLKIHPRSPERYSDSFHNGNAIFSAKSYNGVCPTVRLSDDCQLHSCEFITSTNQSFSDGTVCSSNLNSIESATSVHEDLSQSDSCCIEMKTPENGVESENLISDFNEVDEKAVENQEKCDCLKYPSNGAVMSQSTDNHEVSLHPGLRLSLFPHVPPYVKFATYDSKDGSSYFGRAIDSRDCSLI